MSYQRCKFDVLNIERVTYSVARHGWKEDHSIRCAQDQTRTPCSLTLCREKLSWKSNSHLVCVLVVSCAGDCAGDCGGLLR